MKDKAERQDLAETTIVMYRNSLMRVLSKINKPIDQITAKDINGFIDDYYNGTKNKNMSWYFSTVAKVFFSWMKKKSISGEIRTWKVREKKVSNIDVGYVKEIIKNPEYDFEYRAIVALLVSSGLRVGECLKLRVDSLDFDENVGKVIGKGQKKTEEPEDFVFSKSTGMMLMDLIAKKGLKDSDLLFGKMTYSNILLYFKNKMGIRPHQLRHTFCTEAVKTLIPTDVQLLARHKSFMTTKRYINPDKKRAMAEYRKKEIG